MKVITSYIKKKSMKMMMMNDIFDPISLSSSSSSLISSSSSSFLLNDDINAWSVAGNTLNSSDVASSLFGASLLPYLVLLFFLSQPISNVPKIANFGFQFLLIFVFATIPAGIYAKIQYHDILANVDWLHGTAESFLTMTNLLIIFGFRLTRLKPIKSDDNNVSSVKYNDVSLIILSLLSMFSISSNNGFLLSESIPFLHNEPTNSLSIPTWMVHSSSILEWLTAMKLIWDHAETSGNPRWKGMAIGMIPSHTSGLCACTFHFFYNSPLLLWLVSFQALTTVIGNSTMAFAAYRIYEYEKNNPIKKGQLLPLDKSDKEFVIELLLNSFVIAVLVKYGELLIDFPFNPTTSVAAGMIISGTILNSSNYFKRSFEKEENGSAISISNEGKWP